MTVRGIPEYAGQRFAVAPYAADDAAPEFPEPHAGVNLLTPAATVTENPVRVSWEFEAPLDPAGVQLEYRVQVVVEGIVVIDSGWVADAAQEAWVDVAAVGVADDAAVTFQVAAHQSQRGLAGVDWTVLATELGLPEVAFVEPDPAVLAYREPMLKCRWSYQDSQGKPQAQSRVRLLLGTQVLVDSGWVANVDYEFDVPWLLFDGSRYTVGLRVKNSEGVESVGAT